MDNDCTVSAMCVELASVSVSLKTWKTVFTARFASIFFRGILAGLDRNIAAVH